MDGLAADDDLRARGVEILVFQLADGSAVDGIGVIRAEARDIEPVRAAADLLIGREGKLHGAVRAVGRKQQLGRGQNLRHAGLVVRAEKRRAVGDDQALADGVFQLRIFLRREHDVLFFVQHHVAAIIGFGDAGADVLARGVRRGIHVGDEAVDRDILFAVGRDRAVDVAVRVDMRVGDAHVLHLPDQFFGQRQLPRRRGAGLRVLIRGGGVGDQFQKTINDSHCAAPFVCGRVRPSAVPWRPRACRSGRRGTGSRRFRGRC